MYIYILDMFVIKEWLQMRISSRILSFIFYEDNSTKRNKIHVRINEDHCQDHLNALKSMSLTQNLGFAFFSGEPNETYAVNLVTAG